MLNVLDTISFRPLFWAIHQRMALSEWFGGWMPWLIGSALTLGVLLMILLIAVFRMTEKVSA